MSDNPSTTIADEPVQIHNHASYRPPPEYGHANVPMMEPSSILDQLQLFPLPVPPLVTPRPITAEEKQRIDTLSELQFFLATAPTRWNQAETVPTTNLTKFLLPNGEYVSCVLWNGLYHITGTDIVRALSFRFEAFGRPVKATKKWEEGVFSDLRNLKPGLDASLEEPKSPLLDFLFRNGCIRTQKKQKVFYWFSVPHDRLFLDALERDLKREKVGQPPTTETVGEPARSFRYDPRRSLFEQFAGQNPGLSSSLLTPGLEFNASASSSLNRLSPSMDEHHHNMYAYAPPPLASATAMSDPGMSGPYGISPIINSAVTFQRTLFEGSPAYKKRRVRSRQGTSPSVVDEHMRGQTPSNRSYSEMRSGTISPRMSHHALRKVSGGSEREASPLGLKRERDDSVAPDYDFQQGEKLFVCAFEFCKRPFKRLEHLKRHVRTHTQERPYKCHRCTRSFSRQDNLSQHVRTHGRMDDVATSNNPGLGLGTPPPREGIDYFVATAGSGGQMSFDRWKTASPAGDGFPMHHGMNTQPYRTSGSMPPPSLPYSSRSSLAPPDWNANQSEMYGSGSEMTYSDANIHGIRRYRSATPSSASAYGHIAVPPPPMGWAPGTGHAPSPLAPPHIAAPAHPGPHQHHHSNGHPPPPPPGGGGFSYSFWRPPSDVPYNVPPAPGSVMGSATDSPVINGYEMPTSYPDQQGAENYPTPLTSAD